jgi:RNA polymerase sigma-70 factor (ECF subfamily)
MEQLATSDHINRDAFAAMITEHSRYVTRQLLQGGVAVSDTDDVAQEVFLAVHAQLESFEGRSSLRAWLAGICRNKAHDYRRKNSRRRQLFAAHCWLSEEPTCDAHEQLVRSETAKLLWLSLNRLPVSQRQVLALHELQELPMREVAAFLGCPLDTAYNRYRVGREKLRALLQRDESGEVRRRHDGNGGCEPGLKSGPVPRAWPAP